MTWGLKKEMRRNQEEDGNQRKIVIIEFVWIGIKG
jgi:hypothetical protein